LKKSFCGEIFRRARAYPCPNFKADSHKGCPYVDPSSIHHTTTMVFQQFREGNSDYQGGGVTYLGGRICE
jgi:hypothetical protein